jgi:hypothetical protein
VIHRREIKKKHPVECLGRFAVRYTYIDSTRNTITEEELCLPTWNIRIKEGGQLCHLLHEDPWWSGDPQVKEGTTTTVNFFSDTCFRFHMSGPSPFSSMLQETNDDNASLFHYTLQNYGRSVYLSFGVTEVVFRHPTNWGFMMGSNGSVFTGFPMPCRGRDLLIEDPEVEDLRQRNTDFGFCL